MGGDTLAGGRSSEPGDSLRFTETAAGHGQKIYPEKERSAVPFVSFTKMTSSSSSSSRGAYPLLRFRASVFGVARAAIARMAACTT